MENVTEAAGRLSLSLNGLATDLDTEQGGTDANKRDWARLNRPGMSGELKRANAILKTASAFFAAELDRPHH